MPMFLHPTLTLTFTLGDTNTPSSATWGDHFIALIRAHSATLSYTDKTTYNRVVQGQQLSSTFGNGTSQTLFYGVVTPGQNYDLAFLMVDQQGNESAVVTDPTLQNYAVGNISDGHGIGPVFGRGHFLGDTTGDILTPIVDNNGLVHRMMSSQVAGLINTSGQLLVSEFSGGTLNNDGSISNVDSVTSTTRYALAVGSVITASCDIAKGSSTSNSWLLIGNSTNGYGVQFYGAGGGGVGIWKFVNGAATNIGQAPVALTTDTNYHSYRITITVNGTSNNYIEAGVDNLQFTATDTGLNLVGSWGVTPVTAGSAGKLRNYTASATQSHYGSAPKAIQSVINQDGSAGKNQDWLPDGTTYNRVKATELSTGTVKQLNDGTNVRTAQHLADIVLDSSGRGRLNVAPAGGVANQLAHANHSSQVLSAVNNSGNIIRAILQGTNGVDNSGFMQILNGSTCQTQNTVYGSASNDNSVTYTHKFRTNASIGTGTAQWLKFIIGSQSQSNPLTQCYTVELNPNGSGGTSINCYRWVNGLNNGTQGSGSLGSASSSLGVLTDNITHTLEIVYNYNGGTPSIAVYLEGNFLAIFYDTLGNTGYTGSGSLPGNLNIGYAGVYNGLANSVSVAVQLDIRTGTIAPSAVHTSISRSNMTKNAVVNGNNVGGTALAKPSSYGWTKTFGSVTSFNSVGTYVQGAGGSYPSMQLITPSNGGYYQDVPVVGGQTYTFSFLSNSGTANLNPSMWIGSADGNYTQYNGSPGNPVTYGTPKFYSAAAVSINNWYNSGAINQWNFVYGTFTVPAGVTTVRVILYHSASGVAGTSYFNGVMLTQGTRLQDYEDHETNPNGIHLDVHVLDGSTYARVKNSELANGTVKQLNDGTIVRTAANIAAIVDAGGNVPSSTALNANTPSIPPFSTDAMLTISAPASPNTIINCTIAPRAGGDNYFHQPNGSTAVTYPNLTATFTAVATGGAFTVATSNSNGIQFTGLTSGTLYAVMAAYKPSTALWTIAITSTASAGKFTAAQIAQVTADAFYILVGSNSTSETAGSGGSISGGGCPEINQVILRKRNGKARYVKAKHLRVGDLLKDPIDGWNRVNKIGIDDAQIWEVVFDSETIRVDASHMFATDDSCEHWVNVKNLKPNDTLPSHDRGTITVKSIECLGPGKFVHISCERMRYRLGRTISHNVKPL